ncbi:1765_t:CDS:2, partial [Entrophospora sp. SA101]
KEEGEGEGEEATLPGIALSSPSKLIITIGLLPLFLYFIIGSAVKGQIVLSDKPIVDQMRSISGYTNKLYLFMTLSRVPDILRL